MDELRQKVDRAQKAVAAHDASKAELDAALLDLTQFLVARSTVPNVAGVAAAG